MNNLIMVMFLMFFLNGVEECVILCCYNVFIGIIWKVVSFGLNWLSVLMVLMILVLIWFGCCLFIKVYWVGIWLVMIFMIYLI